MLTSKLLSCCRKIPPVFGRVLVIGEVNSEAKLILNAWVSLKAFESLIFIGQCRAIFML